MFPSPILCRVSIISLARAALAVALCATSLLCGCIGPRYQRPAIPTPPSYRGDEATSSASSDASGTLGELRWQDLIRDEELSKLIKEALANNLDAKIAAARVLEARAQYSVSRADRFPSVDAQPGYSDIRSGGIETGDSLVSANLSWELDLWGRIRNANAAARATLLASEEARRTVLQTLVSNIAGDYFLLRDLDLEIEITKRALSLREDSLNLVQLRVDNGYSSEIDLRQAEVLVKGARASLADLQLQMEQTENQLSILLGRNPGPIVRGRTLLEQEMPAKLPPGLPSTLLDRRPDIRAAQQQLIASHALVAVAKAAYFPVLSLTGSAAGFESPALLKLLSADNRMWTFSPTADLPVFNAGRIRANVRGAEARRQQALLFYQQTVQQAFREVADSLVASRKLAELRSQQEALVASLGQAAELADLRYRGGIASYLEYLDSERDLLDGQLRLAQIRRQQLTSTVTLYVALGGGWQ